MVLSVFSQNFKWGFFAGVLFLAAVEGKAAEPAWKNSWSDFQELISVLESVPEGREILQKAYKRTPYFMQHLKKGDSSLTESTFARTYSLVSGQEQVEVRHEVILNRKLPLAEAVVDLAHELVHFAEKEMLDPYAPGFQLKEFIRHGIEGKGGELVAFGKECQVAWALRKKFPRFPEHALCKGYMAKGGAFQEEKARSDYYAVGTWFQQLPVGIYQAIPELEAKAPVFTSSFARKPYPVALAEEFEQTRRAACANNQRKYRLIASQSESAEPNAGATAREILVREKERLRAYEKRNCR